VRITTNIALLLAAAVLGSCALQPQNDDPRYTSDGQLIFPAAYRDWAFLTSGLDMSYVKSAPSGSMHMFENVFVNPAGHEAFRKTGTWPDKTTLLIEYRDASSAVSINKHGRVQIDGPQGYLAHVKDEHRFSGNWRFFSFGTDGKPGSMLPTATACYTCHSSHAAVDTTFVQFYPSLLPIAKSKGTLSAGYVRESK
jgi:hypothetical protein